ncbi:MAG: IS701 family transposase [bacterium]
MERRFESRREEVMAECHVPPAVFNGMVERLVTFAAPFVERLFRPEQREHTQTFLQGLLSDLQRKNAEAIAYHHDEDRRGLQTFLGTAPWKHEPLLDELTGQVERELGEPDGILVFDPSGFPKKGEHSVGVARQWCGRLGKEENCQVAVFLGYVSRKEHALVDMRLYLPEEWTKHRARCKAAGVPRQEMRFRTRHELALEMLQSRGPRLPHAWIAGDDEMGRPAWFRRELADRGERYLLAVPANTTIRDLEAEPPAYGGRGRRPKVPFQQVGKWCESLPAGVWTRLEVRDATKGPIEVQIVCRRVLAKIDRKVGPEETLVVIRSLDDQKQVKTDYHLSNASRETPLAEFARVANAEHRIEECIKRAKSEAGMAQYQVRNWLGWHHHIALSLIAVWFLLCEARRGKKMDTGPDRATNPPAFRPDPAGRLPLRHACSHSPSMRAVADAQQACRT